MSLINKTKLKEFTELQVSEEFYTELENELGIVRKKAEKRAKDNSRRTLLKRDL
jgi:hypothetical protein